MFAGPDAPGTAAPSDVPNAPAPSKPAKRPRPWALSNWPVGSKVLAIVLVPLALATIFGGLRVENAMASASSLRLAAARADVIPAITKYMSSLDVALLASSTGRDVEGAKKNYEARKYELQTRLADTDVIPDVRAGVSTLLNGGQGLLDKVLANSISLRDRVTTYAPILLTAEDVINASVRVDSEQIRAEAQGLSRAVGARGQMTMQEILVTRGADLPEPELRTSMITLAGTEPSTLFGMSEVLGVGSPEAKSLQQQMVTRMAIMSDPASALVDNSELLQSIHTTDGIAEQVVNDATASVTKSVQAAATSRREAALRDTGLMLAAILVALVIVLLVARALVRPLRALRDGALKVAHTDLEDEITRIRTGGEPVPAPLAVYTTEEIGQVAHAVDELHAQALLLAGDEARLRLLVNDMFETMSRRSRSLVDQQLSLIDRLERDEEDPDRLDSLFRLDHLAARLRRNSANLLVLAGAQLSRDQREPVALSTVISAAVSEVEDYRRVQIAGVPDSTVVGAAVGSIIHLLAELIDNALRYSPPSTPVWVSSSRGAHVDGGVLLWVSDSGLGMNDGDRRIANMRLQSGGEMTPDPVPENARHMGLFVVGRLAVRHGLRVGLRGPAPGEESTGTTAEVYLPPSVLVEGLAAAPAPGLVAVPQARVRVAPPPEPPETPATPEPPAPVHPLDAEAARNGYEPAVTLLPRRTPGSSGITDVPAEAAEERQRRELATPWWEKNGVQHEPAESQQPTEPEPASAPSNTSGFFAARPLSRPAEPATPAPTAGADEDVIYQNMLAEWLSDPHDLVQSPDLDWQSVWDRGWSLAAEATSIEDKPVESRTDHGLPVRTPGAQLVPGAGAARGAAGSDEDDPEEDHQPQHTAAVRDPEAVRASIGSHFGGVHSGRSHAGDTDGDEQE